MPSVAVCITLGKSKIRNFRKKLATSTRLFRKKDALNNPGKFFSNPWDNTSGGQFFKRQCSR